MNEEKSTEYLLDSLKRKRDYKDFVTENYAALENANLSRYLCDLLSEKSLQRSEISVRSGYSKSYIYEIFDGKKKNPSRDTMLIIAFAMELDFEETQDMLKHCGIAQLYVRNKRDNIIAHSFIKYNDIFQCNKNLEDNGEMILAAPIRD